MINDSVAKVLLEKGLLPLICLMVGAILTYYFNNRSKRNDRNLAALAEYVRLRREGALSIIDGQISFQEKRLEQLLWPLSLCLRIDKTTWKKIPDLHANSTMPDKAGSLLESQLILPNHYKAVEIIENNFHLVAAEKDLFEPMMDYVQHVAVYRALRAAKIDANPIDVGAKFPLTVPAIVEKVLKRSLDELALKKRLRDEQITALGA